MIRLGTLAHEGVERRVWTGVTSGLVLLGTVLVALGITPWVLLGSLLLAVTLAVGQRASWPFSFAAAIVVLCVVLGIGVRITPYLGLGIAGGGSVLLVALAVVAIGILVSVRSARLPGRGVLRVGWPVVLLPIGIIAVMSAHAALGASFGWAMHSDAAWSTVTMRLMIADGGLRPDLNPSSAPLTPALLAFVADVGRAGVPATALLEHDIVRQGTLWLLGALLSALLAALIGVRAVHGASLPARAVGAAVVGLLPLSWFMFGFATEFGFYNATLALVLLLASWLAWLETRVSPLLGSAVLSLATIALLATWAPLALIPCALAGAALLSRVSAMIRVRGLQLIGWLGAALPIPLYVIAVTLVDLRRDGAALGQDGGIFPLQFSQVLAAFGLALVVATIAAVRLRQNHQFLGTLIVLGAGGIGTGYLMVQRAQYTDLWGYYPMKMAWLVVSLLLVVMTATLAAELSGLRGRPRAALATMAAVVALPLVVMIQNLPDRLAPTALAPPLEIVVGAQTDAASAAAQDLFAVAVDGRRTMVAQLTGDDARDRFINFWLLQLDSTRGDDPIRYFAYDLDPTDPVRICQAVEAWGGDVAITTASLEAESQLGAVCDADYTVEVLRG